MARKREGRTRSEVLEQQRQAIIGCCSRFADMQSCDCLATALPDPPARKPRKREAGAAGEGGGLLADCLDHPGSRDRMLVYADWLEEQGRTVESYAWRWAAMRGRWPRSLTRKGRPLLNWGRSLHPSRQTGGAYCLPDILFATDLTGSMSRARSSVAKAMSALGNALHRLQAVVSLEGKA